MELELGLKITRTRDDITSYSNLLVSKDPTGPVFLSRETQTAFVLIVYLTGYRRENIDININEDGTRIAVSGRKPVQQMFLKGWMLHKKDVELRVFRRVFNIPDDVILDKINAKFSRHEPTLTITMPKLVKGLTGTAIEEIKEETVEGATPSEVRKNPEEELQGPSTVKEVEDILEHNVAQLEADQVPGLPKDEDVQEDENVEPRWEIEREAGHVQEEEDVQDRQLEESTTGQEEKGHVEPLRIVNEAVHERLPRDEDNKGLEKPESESILEGEEDSNVKEVPKTASHQEEEMVPGHAHTEEEHIAAQPAPISSPTKQTEPEPDNEEEQADQERQPAVHMEQDGEIREVQHEREDELAHDEVPETRKEESEFMQTVGEIEPSKRKRMCPPIVFAGSAIIFSLIVLVVSLIKRKKT